LYSANNFFSTKDQNARYVMANVVRQFLTLDLACNYTYRINAIVKFIIRVARVQLTGVISRCHTFPKEITIITNQLSRSIILKKCRY